MSLSENGFGLLLAEDVRQDLWRAVTQQIEDYASQVADKRLAPGPVKEAIAEALGPFDFQTPQDPARMVELAGDWLNRFLLHTAHPAYFGVFNPQASTMGIAADALVAAFNPQLASSASAPMCIAIEDHLLRFFGTRFGFAPETVRGSFTSGGTMANLMGVLCALTAKLPNYGRDGLAGARPVIYTSEETHHSFLKAARVCGLGTSAVAVLPVGPDLRFDTQALRMRIAADRQEGKLPLVLAATLGSTSAGMFDDVAALAAIAEAEGLWLHADAAWGGAAILLPEFQGLFAGVEKADSITLDPHKWLSVPMGTGMFMTRHPQILEAAFRVDQSSYMPSHTYVSAETEPYKQSLEWSRRFNGLKLFMTLATHGEVGYREVLRHQVAMGDYMRERLTRSGWRVVNETPLPVVCFIDPAQPDLDCVAFAKRVGETGATWITPTKLYHTGQPVLRAGVSNFATQREHIDTLVETLDAVRRETAVGRS